MAIFIEIQLFENLTERSLWHESKAVDGIESDGGSVVMEFHGKRGSANGGHEGFGLVIQGFRRKSFFHGILGREGAAHHLCGSGRVRPLKDESYKGIGIADCKATWKPDVLIRTIAGNKAKKFNTVVLFDYDATLRNAWGLEIDTSNVVLLDKNRVVQVIVRGKVPESEVASIVQIAIDLQNK
jgi:hypothetical protein